MENKKIRLWGFLLFPISLSLLFATVWIGVLYTLLIIPFKKSIKALMQRWENYFFVLAVSIDQFGNVAMRDVFNDLLVTKEATCLFGHEDETISSVLGKNKQTNTLTGTGKMLADLLDWMDPDHVLNSIEHAEED